MSVEELAEEIWSFVKQSRSNLFAGAGVGSRVGFPSWTQWLKQLATVCRRFNAVLDAQLIEERVEQADLLGAASVYKTCKLIPAGEKLAELASAFRQMPED